MKLKPKIQKRISELQVDSYSGYELSLEKICKDLNLNCFEADLDDGLSGLLLKEEGSYSIYVNKNHAFSRQRFTIAHEIGHYLSYLMDSFSKDELEKEGRFEDKAVTLRKNGTYSDAETEANMIAAELLMPEEKVAELMKEELSPEEMADLFYVSPSAMTIRLQTLYPSISII
jgi:Zn-dependent peptidase ImmA (M78 family)